MSFRAMYGAAPGPPVNLKFIRDTSRDRDPDDVMVLVDVPIGWRTATFKVWTSELETFCRHHGIAVPKSPRPVKTQA